MPTDLASLNTRKKANYRRDTNWPPGKRQRLTRPLAKRIFEAMSTSRESLLSVLQQNPDFPPHNQIYSWLHNVPWFAEDWRKARKEQAENLVQYCIQLAKDTNPKNAHAQRVKFDIYRWIAAKFSPDVYGDKPATTAVNVAVGFNVSPERLNEIRGKLDMTRNSLNTNHKVLTNGNRIQEHQSTNGNPHSEAETPHSIPPETPPLISDTSTHGNNHD